MMELVVVVVLLACHYHDGLSQWQCTNGLMAATVALVGVSSPPIWSSLITNRTVCVQSDRSHRIRSHQALNRPRTQHTRGLHHQQQHHHNHHHHLSIRPATSIRITTRGRISCNQVLPLAASKLWLAWHNRFSHHHSCASQQLNCSSAKCLSVSNERLQRLHFAALTCSVVLIQHQSTGEQRTVHKRRQQSAATAIKWSSDLHRSLFPFSSALSPVTGIVFSRGIYCFVLRTMNC